MVGFCETSRPSVNTTGARNTNSARNINGARPSRRSSDNRAPSNYSDLSTTGEIAQPIRVGMAPVPPRQRFFKSIDAGSAATERRKARIGKSSISGIHHSKSVGDLKAAAGAGAGAGASSATPSNATGLPQRARKPTLSTWSSNQTCSDPQRSRGSLQQQRTNTNNGLRGAIRNIFSRTGDESPEPTIFNFEDSHRLSRQLSPLDVGGVLNSLNSIEARSNSTSTSSTSTNNSTNGHRRPANHSVSAPRFIPVRTVQDIPLGISFSDNLFASHPTHIRVPPHHTSYGSSPTKSPPTHQASRSQTSNISAKSANDLKLKRPSTAHAAVPPKGILVKAGSPQAQTSWELYSGYGSGSLPGLGSPSHPLARRPSLRRQKRDSLEMIRTRSSDSEDRPVNKEQSSPKTGIPPPPPLGNTDRYKSVGTPPRSAHGSSTHTAPRMAMEELSLAARLAELEARMTSVETSFSKYRNHQDVSGGSLKVPAAPKSESSVESRLGGISPSTSSSRSCLGSTWLLNDSNPSSRNPSAPHTPPADADCSTMAWLQREGSSLADGYHSPGDEYDYMGHDSSSLKDGIDFLRNELSLIRRRNSGGSSKKVQPSYRRIDSDTTVPTHALDEHVPDFEQLERVRRSSTGQWSPAEDGTELLNGGLNIISVDEPEMSTATIDYAMGVTGDDSAPTSSPMKLQLPSSLTGPELSAEWSSRVVDYTPVASSDGGGRGVESYINLSPVPALPQLLPQLSQQSQPQQQLLPKHMESLRRFNSSSTVPVGAAGEQHGLQELERYQRLPAPPTSAYSAAVNLNQGSPASDASSSPSKMVASWDVPGMPRSRFSFFDDSDDEEFDSDDDDEDDEDPSLQTVPHPFHYSSHHHEESRKTDLTSSLNSGEGMSLVKGINVLRVPSGEARHARIIAHRTSDESDDIHTSRELIERTMYDCSSSSASASVSVSVSPPSPISPVPGVVRGPVSPVNSFSHKKSSSLAASTLAAAAVAAAIAEARKQTAKQLGS